MTIARDVAKELERRARRRKIVILAVVIGAIALIVSYLRCGNGFGFGGGAGGAGGSGSAQHAVKDPGPKRCSLRLDAEGLELDGKKATQAEALAACKKVGRADVVVTGDARQGDWDALRAALDEAGIPHGTP